MNVFQLLPVVVAGAIILALRRARPGSELLPGVVMVAWFALILALAQTGVLAQFDSLPPRIPLIAFGAIALGLVVAQVRPVKEALRAMPSWWPVVLQSFRAPLEVGLYALFAQQLLPEQMTFSGRNFDILVGLSAPVMALAIWKERAPKWLQWAWHAGLSRSGRRARPRAGDREADQPSTGGRRAARRLKIVREFSRFCQRQLQIAPFPEEHHGDNPSCAPRPTSPPCC